MRGPEDAIAALWAAWVVSWLVAALWAARTQKRPPLGSEFLYRILTVIGFVLVFGVGHNGAWTRHVDWEVPSGLGWLLVAATAAGFAFCWWARIHLGRLWSGVVTRKEGHHVVDTGPYALVRHPIYTGIIFAALATAIERGTWLALLGVAVMSLGWYVKARLEEKFLRSELGAAAYDAYAQRTAMLVPFVRI